MKISANKRFVTEDFGPDQRSWIAKLTGPLNTFIEQVIQAVNQGLTTADNFKCQRFTLNISANQVFPIKQAYTLNEKPYSVHVASLRESTGAIPTAPVYAYWVLNNGSLEMTVIGLNAAKSYTVNILAQV